jgi:hypothetical protein
MKVGEITLEFKSPRYFDKPRDGAELLVIRVAPLGLRLEYAQYVEENDWHGARYIRRRQWGVRDNGLDPCIDEDTKIPEEEILGYAELPPLFVGAL